MIPYFIKNRILKKFNKKIPEDIKRLIENGCEPAIKAYSDHEDEDCGNYDDCHLVTSKIENKDTHMPVLDMDYSCYLQESTTEGHFHLYINKEVEWEKFLKVMEAMVDAGLLEEGYYKASESRGYTAVRKPGLMKDDDIPF